MFGGMKLQLLMIALMQFAAKICLLTSFRDTCFIEIVPQHQVPERGTSTGANGIPFNFVGTYCVCFLSVLY